MKRAFLAVMAAFTISLALAGCDQPTQVYKGSAAHQEAVSQENSQAALIAAQPAPHVRISLERANLIKRLNRVNAQNMSGYVYLLGATGNVAAFYPINGKVSGCNSYLTGREHPEQIYNSQQADPTMMVESPDYDGAYGENPSCIFFFTADTDAYVEWKGDYLFSDQPLSVAGATTLIRQLKN